jgi:hypothetical protein
VGDLDRRLTPRPVVVEGDQTCCAEPLENGVDGDRAAGEAIELTALDAAPGVHGAVAERDEPREQSTDEGSLVGWELAVQRLRPVRDATGETADRVIGVQRQPIAVTPITQLGQCMLQQRK